MKNLIFRQLFEPLSSTYTYLIGCRETGLAALLDPVIVTMDRDLAEINRLGLQLITTIDTHIHADHITAARELKAKVGSHIAMAAIDQLPCTDVPIQEGVPLQIGTVLLQPLHTPGHTEGHFAFRLDERIFTGDALLIDGCGRTDFQHGNAGALYDSVTSKLLSLPDETLIYPGHDYENRQVSSVGQEKARNPRLGQGRSRPEFETIMAGLNLPYPKFIDYAVPGNQQCGICPDHLPENLEKYCGEMTHSRQG